LAGRGIDIKTDKGKVAENGGLHLILTYMPSSSRVQKQAEGRIARQGNLGSIQIIVCSKEKYTEAKRDEKEKKKCENIIGFELKRIELNDKVFKEYNEWLKKIK
jgi:preprotein translocase subunit SecA